MSILFHAAGPLSRTSRYSVSVDGASFGLRDSLNLRFIVDAHLEAMFGDAIDQAVHGAAGEAEYQSWFAPSVAKEP